MNTNKAALENAVWRAEEVLTYVEEAALVRTPASIEAALRAVERLADKLSQAASLPKELP